jgi:hypothetical protein
MFLRDDGRHVEGEPHPCQVVDAATDTLALAVVEAAQAVVGVVRGDGAAGETDAGSVFG